MVGIWSAHAPIYLLVLMAVTTVAFAAPIFFTPLAWARVLRWHIPDDTDLVIYFGRCLGAFVLILEALMLRAGLTGEGLVFTFQVLLAVAAMMVVVHLWGAVQRIQPLVETLEIAMYSGMLALSVLFYPV